jgi:hypothetical protein
MVACNVEKFLAEAIESVLEQTFKDFEFIIVDFGSTDLSKSIVANYADKDGRIKIHEVPNCGLAEARNAACSLARGEYLAVMDADDVCLPERLEKQVAFLETNRQIGLVGGATDWIDATGRSVGIHDFPTDAEEIKSALETRFPFSHPALLIRREAFEAVGRYRKPFVFAHDYDLGIRMAERFPCSNLRQVVLKYRIHPQQVSMQKQEQQTLCRLAAQAAAKARTSGRCDPLDSAESITPKTLVGLWIPEDRQRSVIAADRRNWIRSMSAASEYSAAITAATDLLNSNHSGVESWQIADLHLTMARLYWKKREFVKSSISAARAVATRPLILGRPLRWLLGRTGAREN